MKHLNQKKKKKEDPFYDQVKNKYTKIRSIKKTPINKHVVVKGHQECSGEVGYPSLHPGWKGRYWPIVP